MKDIAELTADGCSSRPDPKSDLLFLAHRIPYPPNKGDKLRSYHLLAYLRGFFRVHLGCFVDDPSDWQHVDAVKQLCGDTYFARLNPARSKLRSLASLSRGEALSLGYYRHRGLATWVRTMMARHGIDRILVFSSVMAQYATGLTGVRRVADMVDVDSEKWAQYAREKSWPLAWLYKREGRQLLAFETRVAEEFDATVFVSSAEADLFRSRAGCSLGKVWHAANGVDSDYFSPDFSAPTPYETGGRVLVFTGAMDYWPNVDAVQWFAHNVLPSLRKKWPDIRFAIVGARPLPAVLALSALPGVLVTGTVPDVRPYLAHAAVVVAPLRIARGIQNKVLEGMAMGCTVIASSGAAQGINAEVGREILVADTADEYMVALSAVLEGARDLGSCARRRVLDAYSWDTNLERIRVLLHKPEETGIGDGEHVAAAA